MRRTAVRTMLPLPTAAGSSGAGSGALGSESPKEGSTGYPTGCPIRAEKSLRVEREGRGGEKIGITIETAKNGTQEQMRERLHFTVAEKYQQAHGGPHEVSRSANANVSQVSKLWPPCSPTIGCWSLLIIAVSYEVADTHCRSCSFIHRKLSFHYYQMALASP